MCCTPSKPSPKAEQHSASGVQQRLSQPTLWGLVDCNSFYCSCERLFRPDLAGKPVVVLSNNDGCLIALTPEAKALGFTMGEVYFQVKGRLKYHGVTVFSSNYTLYGDISRRVMQCMESLVPIEQYSIDESFVPFGPALAAQAVAVGWAVHERIAQWVGMPVRVGIGATRTLAKLANAWAKKRTRVFQLELGTQELEDILHETPVVDVWGIGRKGAQKLNALGIFTARQLRDMNADTARKVLTVVGLRTVLELRGQQCIMEEEAPVPRKTLVSSRSFGSKVTKQEDLAQALAMHCEIAGRRLRAERMEAAALSVYFQTSMHGPNPFFSAAASVHLSPPTNYTPELIRAANMALEQCYAPGHGFLKGGITLFDLQQQGTRQLTLLEAATPEHNLRRAKLMQTMDAINARFGRDTLHSLAQGPQQAKWHMQRHLLSGAMTTRWKELKKVTG